MEEINNERMPKFGKLTYAIVSLGFMTVVGTIGLIVFTLNRILNLDYESKR